MPRQKNANDMSHPNRPSSYSLIKCGGLNSGSRKYKTMSQRKKAVTNASDEYAAVGRTALS